MSSTGAKIFPSDFDTQLNFGQCIEALRHQCETLPGPVPCLVTPGRAWGRDAQASLQAAALTSQEVNPSQGSLCMRN